MKSSAILDNLRSVHGAAAVSKTSVYRWVAEFEDGRTDAGHLPRSGRPRNPGAEGLGDEILDLLDVDARFTIREIADRLNVPRSTVHRCMRDMNLVKLSARWVPRLLSDDMKAQRLQTCTENLALVRRRGGWEAFSPLIVTGDETWIPYFDPPTKEDSKVWRPKGSNPPVKARRDAHSRKVMLLLFFDSSGPLTVDFLEESATVNSDRYIESLKLLKTDIRNKRRHQIQPLVLHHDNARPHTSQKTLEAINRLKFEVLPHPPYSPDLAPSDFSVFPALKSLLRGRIHASRASLEDTVRHVLLHEIPRQTFADAIDSMCKRWTKCINLRGDYVEKMSCPDESDE